MKQLSNFGHNQAGDLSDELRKRVYRMKKEYAVYVDAILESYEGLCSFSVKPLPTGASELEMELLYSATQEEEVDAVLRSIEEVGKVVWHRVC
jgi:hypothetical protein